VRRARATIIEHEQLYDDTYRTWFAAPQICEGASVGQFAMVHTPASLDTFWPRAISFHRFRAGPDRTREFSLLYTNTGRGTGWLAGRAPGDEVDMYGPLGQGYRVRPGSRNLLLVAGGIGVAPLVGLAEEQASRGREVVLLLGARTSADLFPVAHLPAEVECAVATDDGSAGHEGFVTELFRNYVNWADQVFACGPNAMFRTLSTVVQAERRRLSVQVLLEENMACGTGICYGCATETKKGMRLVCKDGPMFELRELGW
jgi:dihydroorotate dehydrogenase electron transfer subunit